MGATVYYSAEVVDASIRLPIERTRLRLVFVGLCVVSVLLVRSIRSPTSGACRGDRPANYAYELLYVFGGFVQCVFGVYLALGGRWLVARALRSVYQTCAACGHEIGEPTPPVCQECGLPLPGGRGGCKS